MSSAAVASVLAIAIAAVIYVSRRPKPALQAAQLFCIVKPWAGTQLAPTYNHYYWLADNEALIVPDVDQHGAGSLFRVGLDADGKARLPVPLALSLPVTAGETLSISPNGRYVATIDTTAKPGGAMQNYLCVRALDGKMLVKCTCASTSIGALAWSKDSASVVAMENQPKANLKRVLISTRHVENIALPADLRFTKDENGAILGFTDHGTVLLGGQGLVAQDRDFFGPASTELGRSKVTHPHAELVELSMDGRAKIVRRLSLPAPPGAEYGFIVLSPKGDRLFWGTLCGSKPSPLEVWLHRYLSFVPGDETATEQGWVSRVDGTEMKELGFYEIPSGQPSTANPAGPPWIIDPKWTPDGKRISFIYKDRLLTVPAE